MAGISAPPRTGTAAEAPELGTESRRRRRWSAELCASGALLVFSGWICLEARGLGYWSSGGPGPGFFPVWIAVLLVVLSVSWMTQLLAGNRPEDRQVADPPDQQRATVEDVPADSDPMVDAAPAPEPRRVVGLLAGLVFVAWALDVLGYQLTMVIFLVFLMKVIDRASWRLTLLLAVLAGPGIYHLFADLLAVQLPLSNLPALQHSGL